MRRSRRAGFAVVLVAGLVTVLSTATPVPAHVSSGTVSLRRLTEEAAGVVRVRIVEAQATITYDDPPLRRPVVRAEVLEVVEGTLPGDGPVTFAQHGHGVPAYANGDEALIFLQSIESVPELGQTPLRNLVPYVSRQEEGAKLVLTPASRTAFIAAVRAYAAVRRLPAGTQRQEGLRRVTVKLLASREPWLAASALRDVVTASDAAIVARPDVRELRHLIEEGTTSGTKDDGAIRPIAFRVGLLAELERRRLVDAPPLWVHLVRATTDQDRIVVLRAAAAHPSPELTAELIALVETRPPADVAAAALVALGTPGNELAVPTLRRALGGDDPHLRASAVRALARIGTPSARDAIALAAAFQPDHDTRRRAQAEVTILRGAEGETR